MQSAPMEQNTANLGQDKTTQSSSTLDQLTALREQAAQSYNQAGPWLQQNYGKTIGVVGVLALVGWAGYLMGKKGTLLDSEKSI